MARSTPAPSRSSTRSLAGILPPWNSSTTPTKSVSCVRRYKDPLSKDGKWTLLHYGDIQTLINPNGPGTPAAALGSQGQGGQLGSVLGQSQGSAPFTNGPGSDGSGGTFAGSTAQPQQYVNGPNSDGSGSSFAGRGRQCAICEWSRIRRQWRHLRRRCDGYRRLAAGQ